MPTVDAQRTRLEELGWLSEVAEIRHPLSELRPIWIRHGTIQSGPPVPHPERHPYCEFGTNLRGEVISFVEREQARRLPGDLFLAGAGVPHWAQITAYPHQFVTVYFLPSVLIEMGPERDGARMLRRFTAPQSLSDRLVRPPPHLRREFLEQFGTMVKEFARPQFGAEVRLRTLLGEMLVRLLRWEISQGHDLHESGADVDWESLSRALHYLRTHYAEPVYARDVAAAAGMCESRLKALFREALGLSWVRFLQSYRIEKVAALLSDPHKRVIEAALAVGFDSLSHFNSIFRSFMNVSPTTYQKRILGSPAAAAAGVPDTEESTDKPARGS